MPPSKPSRTSKSKPGQSSAKPALKPRQHTPSAFEKAMQEMRHSPNAFPNVSVRWLIAATAITLLGIAVCAWLTLCLLYWQGSWQLLYHPKAAITRTPASVGLAYEPIRFAVTETGQTQLTGWWLPNPEARFTVLYLHGTDGNLSDTVDALAALHNAGLSVFAIDYRGYGQSQPAHPSEKHLRQDVEWALTWLTQTHQIPAKNIVVYGSGLGANLAAELAADHSELAGIILDQPQQDAMTPVFNDPRSRLVPAHLLVKDRYELSAAARLIRIPSLWLLSKNTDRDAGKNKTWDTPVGPAYGFVHGPKMEVWIVPPAIADPHFQETLRRWLDEL